MFTILNIINYFTGKYVPPIILVLITISVYSYIFYNYFNNLFDSSIIYILILLIVMLIDITSIIIIFSSYYVESDNFLDDKLNNYSVKKNKTNIKDKDKEKVNKKERVNKKNKVDKKNIKEKNNEIDIIDKKNNINHDKNMLDNQKSNMEKSNMEIISLYDENKQMSLHTY
jgi:hypothetical protein